MQIHQHLWIVFGWLLCNTALGIDTELYQKYKNYQSYQQTQQVEVLKQVRAAAMAGDFDQAERQLETARHMAYTPNDIQALEDLIQSERTRRETLARQERERRETLARQERERRETLARQERERRETLARQERERRETLARQERERRETLARQEREQGSYRCEQNCKAVYQNCLATCEGLPGHDSSGLGEVFTAGWTPFDRCRDKCFDAKTACNNACY